MTNLMKTAMLLKLQGIFRDHFLSAIEMGEIVDVGTLMEALMRKGASH